MIITYTHTIEGVEVTPPKGWAKNVISVDFRKQSALNALETSVSVDLGTLIFVNDGAIGGVKKGAQTIIDYVEGGTNGTNGLFEDITYKITFSFESSSGTISGTMFNGFLDMDTYIKKSPVTVEIKAIAFQDINGLVTRARANSFGYLESINVIRSTDYVNIPFIVQSQDDGALLLSTSAIFVLLSIQLSQMIKTLVDDLSTAASLLTGGITGSVASSIYLALSITTQLFLVGVVTTQITRLFGDIEQLVLPSLRNHKSMYLYDLLDKAIVFLGFELVSPILELKQYVYLPSKPTNVIDVKTGIVLTNNPDPEILKGVPKQSDFGYYISDFFKLIEQLFNARFRVIGNKIHVRSKNDPYWRDTATFKPKEVADFDISKLDQKSEERVYNIQDYKANTLISFAIDPADTWTMSYFKNTAFEIIESVKTPKNIKLARKGGLREINIPIALGNRKSELRPVENILNELFSAIKSLSNTSILGIKPLSFLRPLVPKVAISDRIGALMTSNKTHSMPKLLYFINGSIPANHRQKLGADVVWDKWWNKESFIDNNFGGQKLLIIKEKVPFGPNEFAEIIENSIYHRVDGKEAELLSVDWIPEDDTAVLDSSVQEVYMDKLKQTKINT